MYNLRLTTQRKRRLIANAFRVHHKPQYNRLEPAPIAHTLNMYCSFAQMLFRDGDSEGY